MLIDKPYYDYDYEPVPPKPKKIDVDRARKKFRGFFSHTKFNNVSDEQETELEAAERLQREVSNEYKTNKNG